MANPFNTGLRQQINLLPQKKIDLRYMLAKNEEMMLKLRVYTSFFIDQINQEIDKTIDDCKSYPELYKQKIKHHCSILQKNAESLLYDATRFEKDELMEVVAHPAPALVNKFDANGKLTALIQEMYEQYLHSMIRTWKCTTFNFIGKYTKQYSDLHLDLYIVNGWATIAIAAEGVVAEYAKYCVATLDSAIEEKSNNVSALKIQKKHIAEESVIVHRISTKFEAILNSSIQILLLMKCLPPSMEEDYWSESARIALENINRKLMSPEANMHLNEVIYKMMREYLLWYVGKVVSIYKQEHIIPDNIKKEVRKFLKGRGFMLQFINEVRHYAKSTSSNDPWIIIQEMQKESADKGQVVWCFVLEALRWSDAEAEELEQFRIKMAEEYSTNFIHKQ